MEHRPIAYIGNPDLPQVSRDTWIVKKKISRMWEHFVNFDSC